MAHRPVIAGEQITLFVDNQIQLDNLNAIRMHFHHALMRMLNNGAVTVEFQIFDSKTTVEEKKLYTREEKYRHFVELNPVVEDLKRIFGLELE